MKFITHLQSIEYNKHLLFSSNFHRINMLGLNQLQIKSDPYLITLKKIADSCLL